MATRKKTTKTKKAGDLREYRRRRNFEVTPEPPPGPAGVPAAGAPRYMIHKHDATRLHYDLRLELDGALASWAIPKGPSFDPAIRRLAMQTEDHPLEYGNFEGRIPDGEYGGGDSLIWDRGVFETDPPGQASAMRQKGHLVLVFQGEKLRGRFHLVRTRPNAGRAQWIFFKAKDGLEDPSYDVVSARPESVHSGRVLTRGPVRKKDLRAVHPSPQSLLERIWPPMLATLTTPGALAPEGYVLEVKYDGYRGLAAVSGGKVAFRTRNALDLSARFPEIARALGRLHLPEVVLDGEVVAFDGHGRSRFELLFTPGADHRFVAFDLLWLDGEDRRALPLERRRDLLESVLANVPPPLQLAERLELDVDAAMARARQERWEGLIAKVRGSKYEGRRSRQWLKLKASQAQEVAVIGFTPITTGGEEIGALLVGVHEGGAWRFAGKVGTGYSAKLRRELWKTLKRDVRARPVALDAPRMREAVWVEPKLVAQVAFTEWTRDGKLRHPSFQGLREDKRPEQTRRELPEPLATGSRRAPGRKAAREVRAPATRRGAKPSAAKPTAGKEAPDSQPQVELTSPTRLVYPKAKLTKADVAAYYRDVAPALMRALADRPLALKLWPRGVGQPGFFKQGLTDLPPWARSVEVAVEGGRRKNRHLVVDSPQALRWLANRSALELHMWHSRVPHLSEPDWVVFDLDPGRGPFGDVITVARALRGLLDKLGLSSVPKTSGKRGLHVLVPVCRGHTYEDARGFAVAVTGALGTALPEISTVERAIRARGGRLYLDAMQNGQGKTVIAPYSLRGVEDATASTPLSWSEVTARLDPTRFGPAEVRRRLDKQGDLFAPALDAGQRLPRFG